jgi:uncharacterized Ntn-hydrolase superfamily protein
VLATYTNEFFGGRQNALLLRMYPSAISDEARGKLLSRKLRDLPGSSAIFVLLLDAKNQLAQVNLTYVVPGTTVVRTLAYTHAALTKWFPDYRYENGKLRFKSKGSLTPDDSKDELFTLGWDVDLDVPVVDQVSARPPSDELPETGTFSIIAYDSVSGEWGGAVQSRVFSVGNGVLSAEAGVGVVATQAVVDVGYGPQALALLRQGKSAADVVKYVWEHDPDPDTTRWAKTGRQFAVVDSKGNVAAYTGPTAPVAAGDKQGVHVTAQGNTLASKAVPDSMVAAFNRTTGHLAFRLLAAIEAGQAAGGDSRGMQSAAMIIVKKCGGVWLHNDVVLKLQVDDNPAPIAELRRLVEKAPLPPRAVTTARTDPACR